MKTLAIALMIGAGAMLSAPQSHAAPVGKTGTAFAAPKKYGDLAVGRTFKLKCKKITTIKSGGSVPSTVPKFSKNKTYTFKIGTKGELLVGKAKAKFKGVTGPSINDYLSASSDPFKLSTTARLKKDTTKKPNQVDLTFIIHKRSGFKVNSYQVTYHFAP